MRDKVDTMNIRKWLIGRMDEIRDEIKTYIENGIAPAQAVEMAMRETSIGSGAQAQIRYEFRCSDQCQPKKSKPKKNWKQIL